MLLLSEILKDIPNDLWKSMPIPKGLLPEPNAQNQTVLQVVLITTLTHCGNIACSPGAVKISIEVEESGRVAGGLSKYEFAVARKVVDHSIPYLCGANRVLDRVSIRLTGVV